MECSCKKPATHDGKCRDCYEDKLRKEVRDAYAADSSVRIKMMLHKERCRMRLRKNYDGGA